MSSLITEKYDLLQSKIPNYLGLIQSAILAMQEYLAKVSLLVLKTFIISNLNKFNESLLQETILCFKNLFEACTPSELFLEILNNKLPFEPRTTSDKTGILHHLLICLKEIITTGSLEMNINEYILMIERVYEVTRRFDSSFEVRKGL